MNLYRNRIPSTIPFARQAPDLTRHCVPLRSTLKCEDNMVHWHSGVLRKDRWNHSISPQGPFACAGPNLGSGTPGTTHHHVTGPQVVPQCSLEEQPSVHAIRFFTGSSRPENGLHRVCKRICLSRKVVPARLRAILVRTTFYRKIYLPASLSLIHINGEVNQG